MRPLVAFLCVTSLACGSDDATLRVDLRTDLEPRVEFDTLELQVDEETVFMGAAPAGDYLGGVRIAEIEGVRTGSRELLLTLRRSGTEIASRRAIVAVSAPGTAVTIVVSADCASRVCPGPGDPANATECDFGGCIPPEVEPDPDMGVAPDLGAPDLGPPDLGPPDMGALMCPDDPCLEKECSGHGWCTGVGACECDPGYAGDDCDACDDTWEQRESSRGLDCAPPRVVLGTDGDDVLMAMFLGSLVLGGAGTDQIRGAFSSDRLEGEGDIDELDGAGGADQVSGGAGGDLVQGGVGDDVLFGGPGDDELRGQDNIDRLIGGPGNDFLRGGGGGDRYLLDGLGDDRLEDFAGTDIARCAPGVIVASEAMDGDDRVLTFEGGGSVRFIEDAVETIVCCGR